MKATEHRLKPWADLVEHNPRSMKRIVNAVALQQAIHFLEGRQITPETLAQWTILELRWPVLAEFLSVNPSAVPGASPRTGASATMHSVPKHVASLFGDSAVLEVAAANGIAGATRLSEAASHQPVDDVVTASRCCALKTKQFGVAEVASGQFVMRTFLDHAAAIENHQLVGELGQRGKAVGDDDHRLSSEPSTRRFARIWFSV